MPLRRRPGFESPWYSANFVQFVNFTVGPSVSHVVNVALAFLDPDGKGLKDSGGVFAYLSSDPAGLVLAAAPDSVAVGTNGLAIPLTAGLVWELVSSLAGLLDINITKAAGGTYYLNVVMPDGSILTSPVITVT